MGTNFYVRGMSYSDDPEYHIGKRSAAGAYCWDCQRTLCKSGVQGVHSSVQPWHKRCPQCGKEPIKESLDSSSAGRELGFNKTEPQAKSGVSSCCSFSWAMPNYLYRTIRADVCSSCGRRYDDPEKIIEDEYGGLYTLEEFEQVLSECPIQYRQSVGQYFS